MPDLLPLTRTNFSTQEYCAALIHAWPEVTKEQAGVLWAQWAFETGRGKACWNHNLGNEKATPAQVAAGVPYTMLPNTWEILNGKREVFQPPHPQTWFRAFDSLAQAMDHHLAFLRKRYAAAWASVESGDPHQFVRDLKARGYFTGSEQIYSANMGALHAEFMRSEAFDKALADVRPFEPEVEPEPMGIIHGTHLVDAALDDFHGRTDRESDAPPGES